MLGGRAGRLTLIVKGLPWSDAAGDELRPEMEILEEVRIWGSSASSTSSPSSSDELLSPSVAAVSAIAERPLAVKTVGSVAASSRWGCSVRSPDHSASASASVESRSGLTETDSTAASPIVELASGSESSFPGDTGRISGVSGGERYGLKEGIGSELALFRGTRAGVGG